MRLFLSLFLLLVITLGYSQEQSSDGQEEIQAGWVEVIESSSIELDWKSPVRSDLRFSVTDSTSENQIVAEANQFQKELTRKSLKKRKRRRGRIRKGVAVVLALLLGPFGVHRLYLGTSEVVPLIYTVTLGGLMLLPIIDIFCILFTKDLNEYLGNEEVIMW